MTILYDVFTCPVCDGEEVQAEPPKVYPMFGTLRYAMLTCVSCKTVFSVDVEFTVTKFSKQVVIKENENEQD